jgi:Ger(x)C family germination protein
MRGKRIALFLLAMCVLMSSAGCWDAKDIDDRSIATLVVTDRQNEQFVFHVEIPNLAVQVQEGGGGEQRKYQILTGSGETYAAARRQLNTKMELPLFLGAVRVLIVTDELCKHGLEEYAFRMQSMIDYRKTLGIVTTHEKAEDLLAASPVNNVYLGFYFEQVINALKQEGKLVTYTTSDVLEFFYAGNCFVLPDLGLRDGMIAYTGYSIIHSGKYLDYIPLEEAYGLVWLLGDNIERFYTVPFGDNLATVNVTGKKRRIKPEYKDGHVTFNISFAFDSEVLYVDKVIKFDESAQAQVKAQLLTQLVDDITKGINQSISYPCDYLDFKEQFRIAYPNEVNQIDWHSAYSEATFNITAESTLDVGALLDLEALGQPTQ